MTYGEEIKAGKFVVELWRAHDRPGGMDWVNICSKMVFEHDNTIRAEARAEALREAAEKLNAAYSERNVLAVAFCKLALLLGWNAGLHIDQDHNDWAEEWRNVVMIDMPNGKQVSWHMSPDEKELIKMIPAFHGKWDGTSLGKDSDWPSNIPSAAIIQEADK